MLKPIQDKNRQEEMKKNILIASGIYDSKLDINEQYKFVSPRFINISTGSVTKNLNVEDYYKNFKRLVANPATSIQLTKEKDLADIKSIAKSIPVYLVQKDGHLKAIVLPVYGKGLWSTMYGFLALEGDANTVIGLTFYDQKETPGLGGEIDNPTWKKQWKGKKIFDKNWKPQIAIVKGGYDRSKPDAVHKIDAISGASITTRGVDNLVKFWVSQDGFGKFLEIIREGGI
jgi:Na+-transporting NADH:ubiquinone oxidoreductase subunit C